jgi:hypothetical protein
MKIRSIVAILIVCISTVASAVNPLSSYYILNERAAEHYKSNYEYFTTKYNYLYYWQRPSFLDTDIIWGFSLIGDRRSENYQLVGKIKDGVDISSGSLGRIVDKTATRSVSKETTELLVRAWAKAFEIMTPVDRHGVDGTSYYTGVNVTYSHPIDIELQVDGTFWSPEEFSINYDLRAIAYSIYEYLFWNKENEDSIIEKCEVVIRTSQEERDTLNARFQNIKNLIPRTIDPFVPLPRQSKEEKDRHSRYIREYKAMWLQHYQKEEEEFDRISYIYLPERLRMSEPVDADNPGNPPLNSENQLDD